MGPLKAAIVAAFAWAILVTGIFYLHVEVALKGKISKQRDEAMSYAYGQLAALGTLPIGLATYWLVKRRSEE